MVREKCILISIIRSQINHIPLVVWSFINKRLTFLIIHSVCERKKKLTIILLCSVIHIAINTSHLEHRAYLQLRFSIYCMTLSKFTSLCYPLNEWSFLDFQNPGIIADVAQTMSSFLPDISYWKGFIALGQTARDMCVMIPKWIHHVFTWVQYHTAGGTTVFSWWPVLLFF